MTVQSDLHSAFEWIAQLYDESRNLFDDARARLREAGLDGDNIQLIAGNTLRKSDVRQMDYPFMYCAVEYYYPESLADSAEGVAAFLGISFFDSHRTGPTCLVGTVSWSDANAKLDHWLLNATARSPGWRDAFASKPDGSLVRHTPKDAGKKYHPGITGALHAEFPLTTIDGPDALEKVVDALVAAREGEVKALAALPDALAKSRLGKSK